MKKRVGKVYRNGGHLKVVGPEGLVGVPRYVVFGYTCDQSISQQLGEGDST